MKRASAWCALVVVLSGLFAHIPATAQGSNGFRTRPGEVILKFKRHASSHDRGAILSDLGATKIGRFPARRGEHVRITKFSVDRAIARYRSHPSVEFIEPNYVYRKSTIPNDPGFSQLWGLHNTGQSRGLPGADIDATLAWDLFAGSSNILVAITDTGVDWNHPDLAANVFMNPGEIAGNGVDDDHNGFVDDTRGWDFVNDDNDPADDEGHGTHVSGTVGAVGDNGIGVVGVNWRVKILPVKFLDGTGDGNTADAVAAVDYAVSMGAHVINASWGGGGDSHALRDAIASADSAGVLFVAAAGNSGLDNDVFFDHPSSYDLPNIVAVAATDRFDRLAFFSNFGATTVDLGAPGVEVYSTVPGGYVAYSGTSMAAPHVSGALALILGRFPTISPAEAKALLLSNVDVVPSLAGKVVTGGRLNAYWAIADPDSLPPGMVSSLEAVEPNGTWVTLRWTATGDDGATGTASRYELRYSTAPITEANFGSALLATGVPRPAAAGSQEEMRITGLDFLTTCYFALEVFDERGNASPLSNVASVTTLGPPDIEVTPTSLQADLLTNGATTRVLTVANNGFADLNARIGIESVTTPSRLRLLLIHSGNVSEIRALLAGFPDIAVADEFHAGSGAPTLIQLAAYDAVIVAPNVPFPSPAAMGDVLADYVDGGGGVILTMPSFITGWAPQGRFRTGGYSPFPPGTGPIGSSVLGSFDATHPIMAGVSAATGQLLGHVSLASGSELVASWENGEPMAATKGRRVAAINVFVGWPGQWTGDIPLVLHNAAFWTTGASTWLSAEPDTVVVPAGGSIQIVASLDATDLDGGDYQNRLVFSSDDPDEPSVVVSIDLQVSDVSAAVDLDPNTLNPIRRGHWVTAYLELPPPFTANDLMLSTLRLNRASPADPTKHVVGDHDSDGIPDVMLKFDQDLLTPTLDEGDSVDVTLSGELAGDHRVMATGVLRVIRHRVTAPDGGERLAPGSSTQIHWSLPSGWQPHHADVYLSVNGGISWSIIGAGISGTSFNWVVPNVSSDAARVRVELFDALGAITHDSSDQPFNILARTTGVDDAMASGGRLLMQNAPNPFRSGASTTIRFELPRSAKVRLAIFDVEGHLVRVLADGWMPAGRHQAVWQGDDRKGRHVASGVYFYHLQEGDVRRSKRLVVLR